MKIEDVQSVEELDNVAQALDLAGKKLRYRLRYIDKELTHAAHEVSKIQCDLPSPKLTLVLRHLIKCMDACLPGYDPDDDGWEVSK